MGNLVHKIHGGLRMIQVCRDWPKWSFEYLSRANDGRRQVYEMRCGLSLNTRRNRSDVHMLDEIWAFRKYDYFGYRVQPGDVVVDIGGHIGIFATYAAAVCGASRVIVFEPFPENFELLVRNVEENGLTSVTCVNEAVGGKRGRLPLRVDPTNSGGHSLTSGLDGAIIEVQCCTLGDIFDRFGLDRIDYLKMDCEGAEYQILDASADLLERIGRISMEYHEQPDREVRDLERVLQKRRFEVRRFEGHRLYARSPAAR